jgi:Icc-related predicted phosphoesterase
MTPCFFVSDLHGKMSRYDSLVQKITAEKPAFVFIGGDLLPHTLSKGSGTMNAEAFATEYLPVKFRKLKKQLGSDYPEILIILGNDDPRYLEKEFIKGEAEGLWKYIHNKTLVIKGFSFTGYAMVPPTPFQLKDWERYDVSRYVDPGCIPPTEGFRTLDPDTDIEYSTIQDELVLLSKGLDLTRSVWLFHSPPYQCMLDRAALDGIMVDHVPLDVHVGSIAIQRFIKENQPWLTLHGHIHESSRITGQWKETFDNTVAFNASWDGPELALVSFHLESPENARRDLIGK